MKIYILPISSKFYLKSQLFRYPLHNHDYGVEQDFYNFIKSNQCFFVNDPNKADWHYLPIFWTRWHIQHDYAKTGINELQCEVNRIVIDDNKTFTVCQYDDGPVVDLGMTKQFLASRKSLMGFDIPLLCKPHSYFNIFRKKKILASFCGRADTHPLRKKMDELYRNHHSILIRNQNGSTKEFVKFMVESYVALAPRGYGGSSFRFFEAMQLGVVPFLIGDFDTRPFRKYLNWNSCSFFTNEPSKIEAMLCNASCSRLTEMGKSAKIIFNNYLRYQKWCPLLLRELEEMNNEN